MSRAADYVFTSFDSSSPRYDEDWLLKQDIRFLIFQAEEAPLTGRLHWQGFVQFRGEYTIGGARKRLGLRRGWCERRRGTVQQCIDYAAKADSQVEGTGVCVGEPRPGNEEGNKPDLGRALQAVQAIGGSAAEFCAEFPTLFVRHHAGVKAYFELLLNERFRDPSAAPFCCFLTGPTGTGKTRYVVETHGLQHVYFKPAASRWWNGYRPEKHLAILMDDVRPGDYDISYFLNVLDRYPVQVEVKGGFLPILNCCIYVTSNVSLPELFPYLDPRSMAALERRFNHTVTFT